MNVPPAPGFYLKTMAAPEQPHHTNPPVTQAPQQLVLITHKNMCTSCNNTCANCKGPKYNNCQKLMRAIFGLLVVLLILLIMFNLFHEYEEDVNKKMLKN
ncbi:hypothetical protein ACQ4LE_002067 [Meloidogyne hapla]